VYKIIQLAPMRNSTAGCVWSTDPINAPQSAVRRLLDKRGRIMKPDLKAIAPRLGKMLLMLSSNHDGDVVATVRAIERVLKSAGSDWHDLVASMLAPAAHPEVHDDVVQWCLNRHFFLSPRDREFLEGVAEQRMPPSPKQEKWIHDTVGKLERAEAA
jgi:hypothetical protein